MWRRSKPLKEWSKAVEQTVHRTVCTRQRKEFPTASSATIRRFCQVVPCPCPPSAWLRTLRSSSLPNCWDIPYLSEAMTAMCTQKIIKQSTHIYIIYSSSTHSVSFCRECSHRFPVLPGKRGRCTSCFGCVLAEDRLGSSMVDFQGPTSYGIEAFLRRQHCNFINDGNV